MSERLYWDSGAPIKIVDKGGEMSLTLYRSDCGHFFTFSDGIEHPPCPICYELKQYYQLLSQAKKQIEADEKEIDALKTNHSVSVEAWKAEIEKLRGDEAQQRFRADSAGVEIERLRERNMILEQGKELVLIQFSNDILTLLSGFDYATPEKGYSSPSLVLSDLNNFINELRRGAIAEYQLRVSAEQTLRQMVNELKALDLGDSETRIRIYHVLNKYKLL